MSIIYEALKKTEDEENKNAKKTRNINFKIFLWIFLIIMGGGAVLFFSVRSFQESFGNKEKIRFKYVAEKNKRFKFPSIKIEGILYQKQSPLLLYKGKIFREGQEIKGAKIIKIKEQEVIFEYKGKRFKIIAE